MHLVLSFIYYVDTRYYVNLTKNFYVFVPLWLNEKGDNMKLAKISVLLLLSLLLLVSCAKKEVSRFPSAQESAKAKAGELVKKEGSFMRKEKQYRADFATLTVWENRTKDESRLIRLPVVRIYSENKNPAEPVFLLMGGPGVSNIWKYPPAWLLKNHDVVMVGYRGVDGSVILKAPEIVEGYKVDKEPFSRENLQKMAKAHRAAFERLKKEGVDIDGYNMVEVIDDMEAARKALGYGKINLFSRSYGTRLAYIFGLRYPESIQRSVMVGVNPPGHFVWDPEMVDGYLRYYGNLWKKDAKAAARTPDIIKTIQKVLAGLPKKWFVVFNIDAQKVKTSMFLMLYHKETTVQMLDAFVAAENGDYSGLAYLSFMFDQMVPYAMNWAENVSKAFSADFDPNRDYYDPMMPPGSIIGAPVSVLFEMGKYGAWPIKPIPEEYRKLQFSDVHTLMVNGNLDVSTPVKYAQTELLPHLKNGKLVVPREMGHVGDILDLQPEAFQHLAETYYLQGIVDDSKFKYDPINFIPKETFQEVAKGFVKRILFTGAGVIVALSGLTIFLVWFIKRRKKRRIMEKRE